MEGTKPHGVQNRKAVKVEVRCRHCGRQISDDGPNAPYCGPAHRRKGEREDLALGIVPRRLKPGGMTEAEKAEAMVGLEARLALLPPDQEDETSTEPTPDAARVGDWGRIVVALGEALVDGAKDA